jgi:Tfp pilus assembly protein PilF
LGVYGPFYRDKKVGPVSLCVFKRQLAQYYYDKGDFEKAKMGYEELLLSVPQNMQYFLRTIDCYQQLQQFDSAEKRSQTDLTNTIKPCSGIGL